ncbi:MAG: hypothetical protein ACR65Z_12660 [Methylocystis sp.]
MPLVFSPLTEAILDTPPKRLFPKHAFVMRQLGRPPAIDLAMARTVEDVLKKRGFQTKDANASTGGKDFLERILELIRATGFTVAIFSDKTRLTALANIMLELGFAAMCGKPLLIVKSAKAKAPSDFSRTDWISYDGTDESGFRSKLNQGLDAIESLIEYEETLLSVALTAQSMDCAVAFERANKGFLLSGRAKFITAAKSIHKRLEEAQGSSGIADVERLSHEVETFVLQAQKTKRRRSK